ncbi:hypothetical protein OROMI_001143 [Orobanche minor]
MPQTEPSSPKSSSTPLAPMVRLPPRSSAESLFMGGSSISPGPMNLVSSFFAENDPDYDCRSFTQLLAGDAPSPSSAPNAGHDFRFQHIRSMGLVVSQMPGMFMILSGLGPASLLDSPGFIRSNSHVFGVKIVECALYEPCDFISLCHNFCFAHLFHQTTSKGELGEELKKYSLKKRGNGFTFGGFIFANIRISTYIYFHQFIFRGIKYVVHKGSAI